jgi:hypothetical protein
MYKDKLKQISIPIAIILMAALILIYFYFNSKIESFEHNIFVLEKNAKSYKSMTNSILHSNYLRIKNDDQPFSHNIFLYSDDNDSITFTNLIKQNKKLLVFRYSELNCMACIDKEVLNLKQFLKNSNVKIIIIATYSSMRDLYLFKRINQIPKAKIYNIKNQQMGLPIEKNNIPYYFVAETNFVAGKFFVPNKLFPEYSQKYLSEINKLP